MSVTGLKAAWRSRASQPATTTGHAVGGRAAGGSTAICGLAELQVLAMLRTVGSVVEVGSLVATVRDWRESVVHVHDGFDEYQRVVRRAKCVLQVPAGLDDERSRRGVASEHLRQVGIRPVGDVIIDFGLAEVAAFDRVSAVIDQKDHRLVVVAQNCRQLWRRDLKRAPTNRM
jgi:hypothetical protein